MPELFSERVDYVGDHLLESAAPSDPFALFDAWMVDALAARDRGEVSEPTAMVAATSLGDRPSARTVLLKEVDGEGFVFFTNYISAKGASLAQNPHVALHFGWYALHRQVRIEGQAAKVPPEVSDAYFASRPRGSQLGAWASAQSAEVESLEALTASYQAAEERFNDQDVPRPQNWGGYRVTPSLIEFWQGQPSRMHDRLVYRRTSEGWALTRLAP
jgi:pyridoxamine 5'-phosphate oxidase